MLWLSLLVLLLELSCGGGAESGTCANTPEAQCAALPDSGDGTPFNLTEPSWVFRPPVVVHTSPIIDEEGNVFLVVPATGQVQSLSRQGSLRWTYQADTFLGSNVALHEGTLYACSMDGVAFALDAATGKARWKRRVARRCPTDAWTPVVAHGLLLLAASTLAAYPAEPAARKEGNCDLLALELAGGRPRWIFGACSKLGAAASQLDVLNGSALLLDAAGGVHALDVAEGGLLWSSPWPQPAVAGGMAVAVDGPGGVVYSAISQGGVAAGSRGVLVAREARSGQELWRREFEQGLDSVPAVGALGSGRPLAVVVGVAENLAPPLPLWKRLLVDLAWRAGLTGAQELLLGSYRFPGTIVALDAQTGATIWTFTVPTRIGWANPLYDQGCIVSAFSPPAIGADGTVYMAWSAGFAYALRDVDGDGRIDASDLREVSMVETHAGANGRAALAPGMLVVPVCDAFYGYLA